MQQIHQALIHVPSRVMVDNLERLKILIIFFPILFVVQYGLEIAQAMSWNSEFTWAINIVIALFQLIMFSWVIVIVVHFRRILSNISHILKYSTIKIIPSTPRSSS